MSPFRCFYQFHQRGTIVLPLGETRPTIHSLSSQCTRNRKFYCNAEAVQSGAAPATTLPTQHPSSSRREKKAEVYILRSDGYSCSRETVTADNNLQFAATSSHQNLLVWKTKPKCVLVLKKLGSELMPQYTEILKFLGEEHNLKCLVEPHDYEELSSLGQYIDTYTLDEVSDLHRHVDFVCCLGGDGLILHAAYLFGAAIPPVISFKLGSLGFLTSHKFGDYREHLNDLLYGCEELLTCRVTSSLDGAPLMGVHVTLRMRLLCEVYSHGEPTGESYEVMNEVVITRGPYPYLSKIEVYERDALITTVQADGVMLATPTGSTAYSVAAGGSLVHPVVPCMLFTPICPHSLSFRPVILPDYAELELKISTNARSPALVTFDGKGTRELKVGDSIKVKMSPNPVPTINYQDQTVDWFGSIERCFHWNERKEQKEMKLD